MSLFITEHARQRANERLGWNLHTLDRMLERIFHFGLAPEMAPGRLARFLTRLQDGAGAMARAYGQHAMSRPLSSLGPGLTNSISSEIHRHRHLPAI